MDITESVRLIVLGSTSEDINQGWFNLSSQKVIQCNQEIQEAARYVVSGDVKNVSEILKLLEYFTGIIDENPFDVDDIDSNCYSVFLKNIINTKHDISLLAAVIGHLNEHSNIYLSNYTSADKFCEAVVLSLALFSMPRAPEQIGEFKEKATLIFDHLSSFIRSSSKDTDKRQKSIFISLETLHKLILDTDKAPGAALVTILRLVDIQSIKQAVSSIISKSANDENHELVLTVLIGWMSQWLKENTLSRWISEFIQGLQEERRYTVLMNITDKFLKTTIKQLVLPIARPHSMAFVHLLLTRINSPKVFHKVIKDIEFVFKTLGADDTPSTKQCAQSFVDCVKASMIRFPGHPMYDSLEKCMPVQPRSETVASILFRNPMWDKEDKIGPENYYNSGQVGLTNLGNTCYMNSVLQALAMTRQFCQQVITYNKVSMDMNIILRELQNLFALLLYSRRITLAPVDFLRASRPAYFTPGQQQDSSEFLCHLLDVLYEQEKSSCFKRKNGEIIVNEEIENSAMREKTEEDSISQDDSTNLVNIQNASANSMSVQTFDDSKLPTSSSLVYTVFGGESNTTYQCARCHTSSHNNDKFRDLQLSFPGDMPENQQVSVQDLINYYLTPEKLTGDNMYHCAKCNDLCDAQRIIKILRAPAHLILTLKHFHYDPVSRLKAKLRHKVMYNETIDIPVLKQDHNDVVTYQLYAAVIHSGYSMDYGHYFTYARDFKETWFKFNDSLVFKTTLDDFFRLEPPDTPYILFYERINNNIVQHEKLDIGTLSNHIQSLVAMDIMTYNREVKNQRENKLNQRERHQHHPSNNSVSLLRQQRDNSDDDNPPPSNCREAVDITPNRFLF